MDACPIGAKPGYGSHAAGVKGDPDPDSPTELPQSQIEACQPDDSILLHRYLRLVNLSRWENDRYAHLQKPGLFPRYMPKNPSKIRKIGQFRVHFQENHDLRVRSQQNQSTTESCVSFATWERQSDPKSPNFCYLGLHVEASSIISTCRKRRRTGFAFPALEIVRTRK